MQNFRYGMESGYHTNLQIIRNENLIVQRYVQEIQLPHIVTYTLLINDAFLLTYYNARTHTTRFGENVLHRNNIAH